MGCMNSKSANAKQRSRKIDEQLNLDMNRAANEVKILLLGAGESGKSTIVRQMRILHEDGFGKEERTAFKTVVFNNIYQSMTALIKAMPQLSIRFEDTSREQDARHFLQLQQIAMSSDFDELPLETAQLITRLWNDAAVQKCFRRAREFSLNDSAAYFFNSLARISKNSYLPTQDDILRARVKSTGIVETHFMYKDMCFKMFDVGGQRSERKKWIHCFDGVTAVIFCVALSEYDQKLVEDATMNRMQESMQLFESIVNNRWFAETAMIMFLNKKDIFEAKISKTPLSVCFPDYQGANEVHEASTYIRKKFEQLNRRESQAYREVYSHFVCATDTNNIRFVFDVVTDTIISKNLKTCGLY